MKAWVFALFLGSSLAFADEAQERVRAADNIRFPSGGFQADVQIGEAQYRVLSNGPGRTVVMQLAPASDRGTIMLQRDGDLWVFAPSVSQAIRIPMSQRLTGQVANGDIASASFAEDYTASIVGEEVCIQDLSCVILDLQQSASRATYKRVKLWVTKQGSYPIRAEFYSASGRVLKKGYYTGYKNMAGDYRPSKLLLVDELRSGERSMMEYSSIQQKQLPDKLFTKNYLKKLQ